MTTEKQKNNLLQNRANGRQRERWRAGRRAGRREGWREGRREGRRGTPGLTVTTFTITGVRGNMF